MTPSATASHHDSSPQVFGHRGASIELPENTIAAFELAFAHGAEGIELDVALTADGVPVVMHDRSIDRTTNGSGDVDALTLEQLRAVDAGKGETIPTLDEVLMLAVQYGRTVNIELKAPDAAAAVLEVTRGHEGLEWFASSFHWAALEELRRLHVSARLYPLTLGVADLEQMRAEALEKGYPREQLDAEFERFFRVAGGGLDDAIAFATRIGAEGLSIWERDLTAGDIERIHQAGLVAWVWTVNDRDRARALMADGADAICTDDPGAVLLVRAALREAAPAE